MDKHDIMNIVLLLSTLLYTVQGQTAATTERVTVPQRFSLNIQHVESSTSSIEITWSVPPGYIINELYIQANRNESEGYIRTPELSTDLTSYTIEDLMTNSQYDVCIFAKIDGKETMDYVECMDSFTIPLIRNDSLIVLFCVLGYLLLMILIGYICWKRAHSQKEAELEEDEIKPTENGDQSKPMLTVTGPDDRPRSYLEDDQTIPYITPTWEQLEKENQLRSRQQAKQ